MAALCDEIPGRADACPNGNFVERRRRQRSERFRIRLLRQLTALMSLHETRFQQGFAP
jgi:hypothetical protein